jgi:nucleoid DNA-binding protein
LTVSLSLQRANGENMTKEDLIRILADRHPIITKKDSALLVNEVFIIIGEALEKGEEVQLDDFGTFSLADKTLKSLIRKR